MLYDGLAGLSNRSILRDVAEELARQEQLPAFLRPLQKSGSAQVHITFYDYVSYGVGGGDASSEFWYGSFLVLWVDATHPFRGEAPTTPALVLVEPSSTPGLEPAALVDRLELAGEQRSGTEQKSRHRPSAEELLPPGSVSPPDEER